MKIKITSNITLEFDDEFAKEALKSKKITVDDFRKELEEGYKDFIKQELESPETKNLNVDVEVEIQE